MRLVQKSNRISKFLINKIYDNVSEEATLYLPFNGWDSLIVSLHEKLLMLDKSYIIESIGVANGKLTFEITTHQELDVVVSAMYHYIHRAEYESTKKCIHCGKPGFLNVKNGEILTFCKGCG